MLFDGPLLRQKDLPRPLPPEEDHYLQIGLDEYLGPSGRLDDLINHSCNPNASVSISEAGASLVAIRYIHPGEELSFDYSLTSTDDESSWNLSCSCGSPMCRKLISGFHTISPVQRKRYFQLGIVPDYILEYYLKRH